MPKDDRDDARADALRVVEAYLRQHEGEQ